MKLEIPQYLLEQKFFERVGNAKRTSSGAVGCCPFCHEGNSWGKKTRFNYYKDKGIFCCFNCGINLSAVNFMKKVDNVSYRDVVTQVGECYLNGEYLTESGTKVLSEKKLSLPSDSINLFDETQTNFYGDDYFVKTALKTIRSRKLHTAKYRRPLYISRDDFIHKNRIIIPFYDMDQSLLFYQSRSQTQKQESFGKYLSALDSEKTMFGLDGLDVMDGVVFILEGPLDCFFLKNSIGGGGLKLNDIQRGKVEELKSMYDVVWVLDNDFGNNEVKEFYLKLIKEKEKIFLWGEEYFGCKDLNEYCCKKGIDEIDPEQILERTYIGKKAFLEFAKLI